MKRKKPRIFLTPELKAYYRDQYPTIAAYMRHIGKQKTRSQVYRALPFMDRIEKLECMHPLMGYFTSVNAKPGSAEDLTSICIALSKPALPELKSTIMSFTGLMNNEYLSVGITSYDTMSSGDIDYEVPDQVRQKLLESLPEDTDINQLDWIFNRTRYFNVEHIDIRVMLKHQIDEDTFTKSSRVEAALERVVQIVEFVGESVDMMTKT